MNKYFWSINRQQQQQVPDTQVLTRPQRQVQMHNQKVAQAVQALKSLVADNPGITEQNAKKQLVKFFQDNPNLAKIAPILRDLRSLNSPELKNIFNSALLTAQNKLNFWKK